MRKGNHVHPLHASVHQCRRARVECRPGGENIVQYHMPSPVLQRHPRLNDKSPAHVFRPLPPIQLRLRACVPPSRQQIHHPHTWSLPRQLLCQQHRLVVSPLPQSGVKQWHRHYHRIGQKIPHPRRLQHQSRHVLHQIHPLPVFQNMHHSPHRPLRHQCRTPLPEDRTYFAGWRVSLRASFIRAYWQPVGIAKKRPESPQSDQSLPRNIAPRIIFHRLARHHAIPRENHVQPRPPQGTPASSHPVRCIHRPAP